MTQYDVGPGEWSDREWETGDRPPKPQAKRRRLALPPWALLVILVAAVIVLCVALVLIVRAIRADRAEEALTPDASEPAVVEGSATADVGEGAATSVIIDVPTATVALPLVPTEPSAATVFTEIAPGATVEVANTGGQTLRLRSRASTGGEVLENLRPGTELIVLEGPEAGGDFTWWKVRTPAGKEGWAAATFLKLKP